MKFYFLLLSLTFSANVIACDTVMKDYTLECNYQDHFNKLKENFKVYNTNPLTLKGHILPYALGDKNYNAKKNEYLNHSNENLESNQQWITWQNSQVAISKLNPIILEVGDILKLHTRIFSTKSIGDIFNSKLGKLRTGNAEVNPTISYSCEDGKITDDTVALMGQYDLKTSEGYPLLALKDISTCKDLKNTKSGKLIFYKNASVASELNRWLVDFNDALLRYEMNKDMEASPFQYLADMRRWFIALSPFSIGNENVVEALIQYASHRLHLPPLAKAPQGEPILTEREEHRKQVITRMKESLIFFESCLYETKVKVISEQCRSL